jgi:hypothetical protein
MMTLPIEDFLEWVYRIQRADVVLSRNDNRERNWLAGAGISGDGCAILERQSVLGTRIDGGGYAAGVLHPDAEATHITIGLLLRSGALSHTQVGLLLECGKTGGMPVWDLGEQPKPKGRKRGNGKGYETWGGKFEQFCPIEWEPPLDLQSDLRNIYTNWFNTLKILHSSLSSEGALSEYSTLFPAVSAVPWGVNV